MEFEQLSLIAKTRPHAAYAAYTHGLSHKWKFHLRTILNIGDLLTLLKTAVCHSLTPSITGKNDLNDHMRRIIALPTRLGGVSLDNPQSETESEYPASHNMCHPIADLILQQWQLNPGTLEKQRQARSAVRQEKRQAAAEDTRLLLEELPDDTI